MQPWNKDSDAEFYWDDGSPLDFTAWEIGFPTNQGCVDQGSVLG